MITCEQEINMASEMENVNEELIEELTAIKGRKKAASDGKDRGRARSLSRSFPEVSLFVASSNPLSGFATTHFLIPTIIKYFT